MKKTVLLALALLVSTAQAATIYECSDRSGRKVYSQDGGKNCKASNIGRPSVYTSAPVYQTAAPVAISESTPQANTSADLEAAQRELQQAQHALEEGKKVRLGNERNYAKYLERVQGLENNVKAAQDKVHAAERGESQQLLR
ncbi:DUF4124 domain-containing protein [Neisseria weixii]|uniref:DUF4124 domain-containing protein n=1 Tax=Neisseria weixii TaxID=1853276 RepID=A0A3N4MZT6_9NEIS|nr:DUF4124 domain-containing protein [Neisseria weixii]ATD64767.1 lipoic acid synthetase [Neisseria weixii]RPD89512.1 DUF4124 domain-containing protein [Neisseria weixii]RPD89849.1 DUF4124 domain-containing protein [Neisseria weixii]